MINLYVIYNRIILDLNKQLVLIKGWLKLWYKNYNQKELKVVILNHYNGQRRHYIFIKKSIIQRDITL